MRPVLGVTLYTVLKSFHVLAAVTWVGGNITNQILATRLNRHGSGERRLELLGDFEYMGMRLYMPASLALLGLGIWMVIIGPWSFAMFWVDAALGMFAYSFVTGAFYLGPQLAKTRALAQTEGPDSAAVQAKVQKLFLASRIELVLLVLIVFDMVIKPGA
jgi:hypothetical protein